MKVGLMARPERLAALRALGILDTPPEECFDRLTRVASRALGAPVTLVSLVDEDRQFFKSAIGLPEPWASRRETPLSHSFCQHVVDANAPLNIEDARKNPLVQDNLAIPDLGVIAYLGYPLTDSGGCPLGAFCAIDSQPRVWTPENEALMHDLAQAAISELELRRLALELHQLNQEKNELLGIAAHDLRNPLSAISGYFQLLLESDFLGPLTEKQRRVLEKSSGTADFMLRLLNDLLDVSKVNSGRLKLQLGTLDLAQLTLQVVDVMRVAAEGKSIDLTYEGPPKLLCVGDSDKLQQVLQNLISNALKFSHRDTRVRVVLERREREAVLSVVDQGQGIPEAEQARLFEPFHRASVRPTGGEKSTGLGLAITRKIVEGHGGRIELESAPGHGSTFRFVLPSELVPPALK